MAYELLTNAGKDQQVEIALARAKILQQDFVSAETHITQALSIDYENVEAWALWGHVKYLQLDFEAAKGSASFFFFFGLKTIRSSFLQVDINVR